MLRQLADPPQVYPRAARPSTPGPAQLLRSARVVRKLIAAWGVLGVVALLSQAILRLTPLALEAMRSGLSTGQWITLVLWVAFMAHAEGYRGFHTRLSPRVVARAAYLLRGKLTWARVVFAPFFCTRLFGASKKGMWTSRILLSAIFGLIVIVRSLDQPWRGIIDAGVVVGLGIGVSSIVYHAIRALAGRPSAADPDLPEDEAEAEAFATR